MLELTEEELTQLQEAAVRKTIKITPDATGYEKLAETIAHLAVHATITTILEYEKMKSDG